MQSYVLFIYEIVFESKPEHILELGVGSTSQSTRTILSALLENDNGLLISIDSQRRGREIENRCKKIIGNYYLIQLNLVKTFRK